VDKKLLTRGFQVDSLKPSALIDFSKTNSFGNAKHFGKTVSPAFC